MQGLLSRANISPMWGTYDPLLSSGLHSPRQLASLAAWYDVSDLSSLIYDGSNRVALMADKSGNSNVNVLCLNGVAGNYASTPNAAPLQITGDIELVAKIQPVLGVRYVIISKWNVTGNQRSYILTFETTGAVQLDVSADGSATITNQSTTTVTLPSSGGIWIKANRVSSTGLTKFYTSPDGSTWSQLGADVAGTSGAIFNGTAALQVGAFDGAALVYNGLIYRAQIYNGIAGTLVFDANFATASKLASSFPESSSNAATVTINTSGDLGARICGARDLYQGTVANQPVLNVWSGTNYGYLNGVSGNRFTSGTSVDATGSLDIRVRLVYNSGTAAFSEMIGDRASAGTEAEAVFRFSNPVTALNLLWYESGVAKTVDSSAHGVSNGTDIYFRVTRNNNNGGVYTVTFYKSTDGTNWTQISTHNGAAVAAPTATTNTFVVGGITAPLTALVYSATISALGGADIQNFSLSLYSSGTTFVSATGETWTINGGATIVTRTSLYFDGSNDYLKAAAWSMAQPETVYFVGQQVSWTAGHYIFDGNTSTSILIRQKSSGGASPDLELFPGTTLLGPNSSLPVQTAGIVTGLFNGSSSGLRVNRLAAILGGSGTVAGNGFQIGAQTTPANYGNITASEILIYNAAHDTVTQDRTLLMLGRKWHIAV